MKSLPRPAHGASTPDRAKPETSRSTALLVRKAALFAMGLLWLALFQSASALEVDFRATASRESILFEWALSPDQRDALRNVSSLRILEIPGHSAARITEHEAERPLLVEVPVTASSAQVVRFSGKTDRIFSRFVLEAGLPPHTVRWVTDFSDPTLRKHALGLAHSKKGLACLVDTEDARSLEIAQINQNIIIGSLLDLQSADPALFFEYEGRRIGLHPKGVAALDRDLQTAHKNRQRVTGILLNHLGKTTDPRSALLHPLTPLESIPIGPCAFNTATAEGLFYFRAIVHWIVERYTRADAAWGWLAGLVVGNEMQSHWSWYHLGARPPQTVIAEYTHALRIADLAARSLHADFRCYVSLEHHWALSASEDPLRGFSALEALEGIQRLCKAEGDFPWALAFHPYPENLFNPAFWKDGSAPLRMDAPRITFHNLEVLPAFLEQPRFLFRGMRRPIALTEQGFHCPEAPQGESLQAAAYALAWKKISHMPAIESFLYHRHVDHPHEHGLHCGTRAYEETAARGMGRARQIHAVIRAAGGPGEDAAFAFALPILGRTTWDGILATSIAPARPPREAPQSVVIDLLRTASPPEQDNLESVQKCTVEAGSLSPKRAVLLHPKPQGSGRWVIKNITLPTSREGTCRLQFDLLLNHPESQGAAFFVEINGQERFRAQLSGAEHSAHAIDLRAFQGQTIHLALGVDCLKDPAYDWCTWIEPRVILSPPAPSAPHHEP